MMTQNTSKLEKLVEFAKKGGIGTCIASQDIIAESETELMFCTGEVITVLKHVKDDVYLGYCEGVIGIFKGKTVEFNGTLKNPKSMKSEKRVSPTSSVNGSDQSSPKQTSFLNPNSQRSSLSSLGLSDIEYNLQSSPSSPVTINIIADTSENVHNDNSSSVVSQNKVPIIIPSLRKSSISSDHSIPVSPRKQSTMPQLSSSTSSPKPIPQRRNNTVPIIAVNQEQSINSNSSSSSSLPIVVPKDKTINSQKVYNPQPSSDPSLSSDNDQIITRTHQNSTLDDMQNVPIERPRGSSLSKPNGHQIPETIEASKPEFHRSVSAPIVDRSNDSSSNSPVPSKSIHNKRHSQTYGLPSSPKSGQYNPASGKFMLNGKSSPSGSITSPPRSPLGMNQPYQSHPNKVNGRNSPSSYSTGINDGIPHKSVVGHYSPSTTPSTTPLPTPLPSPKMPQLRVLQEENVVLDGRYSPSTTPLPSPRFVSRNINNNLGTYEGRITVSNTPVSTPVIVTPKITLEDSDVDDSDFDQEGTLSSSRNNSMKSSSSSYNQPRSAKIFTLKVDSRSDTPSEQMSANESEDVSSEDEDEIKVIKVESNESESGETQPSKPAKKKKEQILAIDEYGFVYDVAEEDIPPGADRIQRIIQAPGTEEKTTRTIRLYREREAKWVALLGSRDPIISRDSRKIKKLVRLGIPESVRGKAWQFMAGADKYRKPHLFDELRNKQKLPIYDVIERDIHRCYPDHIQFREETGFGQDDLHNILKAYAHYNPAVGYCQGMGRLVGMMLMQMPAEDTFWLLVATIEEYMVGYFTPTLSQVRIDSIVFEQLLAEHDPKLSQHLANNGVIPLMYMTQWFMTTFTMALPWASVLRVWDIFYFEGVKLFFRIGLSILDCTKEHILKNCPTNSEILQFLLHIPHELLTPDLLLEAAFKIRLKRSVIRRMTKKAIAMEKSNEVGSDTASVSTAGCSKETRRGLMKKSKSVDKLKVDGVEFKLVGE